MIDAPKHHLKQSLNANDKMRLGAEFEDLKNRGIRHVARNVVMVVVEDEEFGLKMGVICSRKFHKHAVRRNRARRLVWETMRKLKGEYLEKTHAHLLFLPRQAILSAKQQDVQADIVKLLFRSGLAKKDIISG